MQTKDIKAITFHFEGREGNYNLQFQKIKPLQYAVICRDTASGQIIYNEVHIHIHTVAAKTALSVLETILKKRDGA